MFIHCIIFILLILCTNIHGAFLKNNEETIFDIKYVRTCEKYPENLIDLHIVSRKYNRTTTIFSSNCTLYEPFGKDYIFHSELWKWSDGGWKFTGVKYVAKDACNSLNFMLKGVWNGILKAGNIPEKCPIPAGFYKVDNYSMNLNSIPFLYTASKYYGLAFIYKEGNIQQACVETEVEVKTVPKI